MHWLKVNYVMVMLFGAGADPGRNLTRAQQKDRGRGYMDVENIP